MSSIYQLEEVQLDRRNVAAHDMGILITGGSPLSEVPLLDLSVILS